MHHAAPYPVSIHGPYLKRKLRRLVRSLKSLLLPRRFHGYGLGCPRSGTASMASMFSRYRSSHEPSALPLMQMILGRDQGRITAREAAEFLILRDRLLYLELESNFMLIHVLDLVVDLFPRSRFMVPVRDCYSWLESMINTRFLLKPDHFIFTPVWKGFFRFRYPVDRFPHSVHDKHLAHMGLPSIEAYFWRWQWHYDQIRSLVPPERLLQFRIRDLSDMTGQMADFFSIDASMLKGTDHLCNTRTHIASNRTCDSPATLQKDAPNPLATVDRGHIDAMADRHCRWTMERWYPDLTARDVLGR